MRDEIYILVRGTDPHGYQQVIAAAYDPFLLMDRAQLLYDDWIIQWDDDLISTLHPLSGVGFYIRVLTVLG